MGIKVVENCMILKTFCN